MTLASYADVMSNFKNNGIKTIAVITVTTMYDTPKRSTKILNILQYKEVKSTPKMLTFPPKHSSIVVNFCWISKNR
jgi:hypothetical protein